MYFSISIIIGITLVNYFGADAADDTCSADSVLSATQTLRKKIFCGYDRKIRPEMYHTNATDLQIIISIRFLTFETDWDDLSIYNLMKLSWQDKHLTWDPALNEGISEIPVNSDEIWVPDVEMFSSASMSGYSLGVRDNPCTLQSSGNVTCITSDTISSRCIAELRRWPFDTKNCTVIIGSWVHFVDELRVTKLEFKKHEDFEKNRNWEMLGYDSSVMPDDNTMLCNVLVKRHPGGQSATVVVPGLVLAMMTLVIFWLDAQVFVRLALICVSILCHCIFLQFLGAYLPHNGADSPLILLFFRDSLLLVGVSLFITMLVRRLDAASSAPPAWITTITDAVLATLPGQILMSGVVNKPENVIKNGDGDETISVLSPETRWRQFALLLDRITFLVFILTLTILVLTLLI